MMCVGTGYLLLSAQPIVVSMPIGSEGPDENEKQFPKVFTAYAVTRAMDRASKEEDYSDQVDCAGEFVSMSNTLLSISHRELVSEQRADPTLKELFQSVLSPGEVRNDAQGYVIQN